MVAQILEMTHFVDQHRMAQMQIRRSRVETRFHPKRFALFEFLPQVLFPDDFVRPTADPLQRFL